MIFKQKIITHKKEGCGLIFAKENTENRLNFLPIFSGVQTMLDTKVLDVFFLLFAKARIVYYKTEKKLFQDSYKKQFFFYLKSVYP